MNANRLVLELEGGYIARKKRWSGDTFQDYSSGCVDIDATDALMADAARTIRSLQQQLRLARQDLELAADDV